MWRYLASGLIAFATLVHGETNRIEWVSVGLALDLGDYSRAEALLEGVENNAAAWSCRGLIHTKRHQYDQAEAAFKQALLLQPDNGLNAWNLGEFYYLTGKWTEAVAAYDQTKADLPQRHLAIYKSILALLQAGQRDQAWLRIAPLRFSQENPLFLYAYAAWHLSDGRLDEGRWFAESAASLFNETGVRVYRQSLVDAGWLPRE